MEYPYIKNITHEKVQTLTSLVNAEDGQIVSKTLAQNSRKTLVHNSSFLKKSQLLKNCYSPNGFSA